MDNATTLDIVNFDDAELESENFPWGKEIAKSLTLSAAQTAGVAGGFIVVAIVATYGSRLYTRFIKKNDPEVTVITDLPKASES